MKDEKEFTVHSKEKWIVVSCERKNWIPAPACAGVTILRGNDILQIR